MNSSEYTYYNNRINTSLEGHFLCSVIFQIRSIPTCIGLYFW